MKGPMELKTKRLLLRPLSDEALAARLAEESDPGMRAALEEMLAGVSNVRLEFADALKADLAALMGGRFAVVTNLPYYITADMVMKLLKSGLDISCITIMVQKEAAARMMAQLGEALHHIREMEAVSLSNLY